MERPERFILDGKTYPDPGPTFTLDGRRRRFYAKRDAYRDAYTIRCYGEPYPIAVLDDAGEARKLARAYNARNRA